MLPSPNKKGNFYSLKETSLKTDLPFSPIAWRSPQLICFFSSKADTSRAPNPPSSASFQQGSHSEPASSVRGLEMTGPFLCLPPLSYPPESPFPLLTYPVEMPFISPKAATPQLPLSKQTRLPQLAPSSKPSLEPPR